MTPERWQQIDELFHAALTCDLNHRADFLASQCAHDESLRREVESLISAHSEAADFIEQPAGDVAAELLGTHQSTFAPGQQIENYRIIRQLGSGGMGEVYLAEDLTLQRKVALKLLPPHFTVNPDRVRRFDREARAASALNHPNIVTIYEIRKSGSMHFIATEYIDGKTLRQLINEKPFTLDETLKVSMQVADALSGAHAAGIVHRDIKPENIMLRHDGYVKILDFGLAKLTEQQTIDTDLEEPTLLQTNPGLVMGTVQYMSPEQARGKHVDARTDIWSLGIVLYELLTGQVPFTGATPHHVIVALMEDELPPVSSRVQVPSQLAMSVDRALRKNRRERYQTAAQLSGDLKRLRQDLQGNSESSEWLNVVPSTERAPAGTVAPARKLTTETDDIGVARPTAGAVQVHRVPTSGKRWLIGMAVCFVIGLVLLGVYRFLRRERPAAKPAAPFQKYEMTRLTNSGEVNDAAISSQGKAVAYVVEHEGKQSIWLQHPNSNDVQIVPPTDTQFYGVLFTNAADNLYYIAKPRNDSIGTLYRVPSNGGEPVKIIPDVDGPISLSPDEKQFAFVRGSSTGERALMLATTDGLSARKLVSRIGYEAFSFGGTAWSPDGKSVVTGATYQDGTEHYATLVSVDVSDGSISHLTQARWRTIGRLNWLSNGRGLVFVATALETASTSQIWYLPYPNGEPQRITKDLQDYQGVTITGDGTTLIAKQTQTAYKLWVGPNGNADAAKEILSHKEDDAYYVIYYSRTFSWAPDGRILYTSLVNGNPSVWSMTSQGTEQKQLTNLSGRNNFPFMMPDSHYIIFVSDRSGTTNLWRIDADGGNQIQLSKGEYESWGWPSPDSHWIVYHSGSQGKHTIWRIPTIGGAPEQLTDYPALCPVVSPDGQWISLYYRLEPKASWKLGVIPISGGLPVKTFEIPTNVAFESLVRWTRDGKALAMIQNRDGVSNIWVQPLDGSLPRQLTNFKSEQIFWFDWSPDGNQLAVSRGTITSDVVLVKDLGQK